MKIIAINGKSGSGKSFISTCLQYLLDDESENFEFINFQKLVQRDCIKPKFEIVSFADKLKECASIILNCKKENFENHSFKNSLIGDIYPNLTYRQFLNQFADLSFQLNQNIWSNSLFNSLKENHFYIISDLRFKHEFVKCKSNSSFLIRIKSNQHFIHDHVSETDLDDVPDNQFDLIIDNSNKNTFDLMAKLINHKEQFETFLNQIV